MKNERSLVITLFVLGMTLLYASHVPAVTINVPGDYATISQAISVASNGDTILVAPGTYTQNLNFGDQHLSLISTAGPDATSIQVNGGKGIIVGGPSEIRGFTISGASASFGAAIDVSGAGTIIRGNIFDGNAQSAGGFGAAIGGNSASPVVHGNIFRHNTADGQHLSGVVAFVNGSSPIITNNIFEDNPTRAINLTLPSGNYPRIVNNTFVRNQTGMKIGSFSPVDVKNNIVVDNFIGVELDYPDLSPNFTNNLVFGNGDDYAAWPDQTGIAGNISVNPLFVNPSGDYHLLSGSPAVDAGIFDFAAIMDFDGRTRPIGPNFDMGAFERVPEPTVTQLASVGICIAYNALKRRRSGH